MTKPIRPASDTFTQALAEVLQHGGADAPMRDRVSQAVRHEKHTSNEASTDFEDTESEVSILQRVITRETDPALYQEATDALHRLVARVDADKPAVSAEKLVLGDLMDAESIINGGRRPFVEKVIYYCMELLDKDNPTHVIGHIESECRDYEKLIQAATAAEDKKLGRNCFSEKQARSRPFLKGRYTQEDALQILKNVGIDTTCGACMEIAFTGVTTAAHECTYPAKVIPPDDRYPWEGANG